MPTISEPPYLDGGMTPPTKAEVAAALTRIETGERKANGEPVYRYSMSFTVTPTETLQQTPIVLSDKDTARITAKGRWFVVGWHGPGGNGINAHGPASGKNGGFYHPGVIEGCLLVVDGTGTIQAFKRDDDTILVRAPGRIAFGVNDEPHPNELDRHKGYADNAGSVVATISWHD